MTSQSKYEKEQIGLWFALEVNNEEQVAFISEKALNEHFDAEKRAIDPMTVYKRYRKKIDLVARRKFINNSTGPIILRVSDFDLKA